MNENHAPTTPRFEIVYHEWLPVQFGSRLIKSCRIGNEDMIARRAGSTLKELIKSE